MANWKLFLVDSFPQFLLSVLVFGYGFQLKDFTYFKANPLQQWEILSIYSVVFFFIFKNVLPKFFSFGGARRHYNDIKSVEKKGLRSSCQRITFACSCTFCREPRKFSSLVLT